MQALAKVNIPAIIVAALVNHIIGFIWYAAVFGEEWASLTNAPMGDNEQPMVAAIIGAILFHTLTATGIAWILKAGKQAGLAAGIQTGLLLAITFAIPLNAAKWLWQQKFELFAIDAGITVIGMIVMSVIIAVWQKAD